MLHEVCAPHVRLLPPCVAHALDLLHCLLLGRPRVAEAGAQREHARGGHLRDQRKEREIRVRVTQNRAYLYSSTADKSEEHKDWIF